MERAISEDSLARLSDFVADRMGLHFPPDRWPNLARSAARAAAEFKFTDPEAFIRWLPGARLDAAHMEILAGQLTINETYFWRETGVFDALTGSLLPELARRRQGEKRLRLWSAGCSTGEEPYSLAIALHRAVPFLKDWNITILATDISAAVLRKAARGVYGEWSFRNAPPWLAKEYFTRRPDGKYELDAAIKKMVAFEYLNLAEDSYPSPVNNTSAMDLVFCRNVLMYFVPALARRAVGGLYNCLTEGGYAVVSSCELSQSLFSQFSAVNFPGAIVYKKGPAPAAPPPEFKPLPEFLQALTFPPPAENAPAWTKVFLPAPPAEEALLAPPAESAPPARRPAEAPPAAAAIRALGDGGKLTEALALCEEAVAKDKLNPELHYLHALLLLELRRDAEAPAALKKALYLAPDLILAHFTLGKVLAHQGKPGAARRHFRNAQTLLEALEPAAILPESDGLTAGRFREIVNLTMEAAI